MSRPRCPAAGLAALLLLASSFPAAAGEALDSTSEAVAASDALLGADDECAAGDGAEGCALNALQLRAQRRQTEQLEADADSPPQHWAQDCWTSCGGKPGFCEWCGHGNACCRYGATTDPAECAQTTFWPTIIHHTCVNTRAPPPDAPAGPGGCADSSTMCAAWAKRGECEANAAYMKMNCGVSCKLCEPPTCEDKDASCPGWAKRGECTANKGYMDDHCKKSCGLCAGGSPSNGTSPANPVPKHDRIKTPPTKALGYGGIAWPEMVFEGTKEMHILAIGDWGGMDGTVICHPRPKKPYYRIIQYKGGDTPGPHVMARSRYQCKTPNLVECFNTQGMLGGDATAPCEAPCGWEKDVDDKAQLLVAEQFKKKAAEVDPQFVINVGDNFYWGGIETDCGEPMTEISEVTKHQFNAIFEDVYSGPGLNGKPWLSVLGNHDWGGRYFNAGWDQQIAYTWASDRWILPAPYWSQHVKYPDQGFTVDIFMIDSNAMDAQDPEEDPEHNICGALHNPENASCTAQEGPPSVEGCKSWFWDYWHHQQQWLEEKLAESTADWQIVNTHFPCGHQAGWYAKLHQKFGLDLLVTGHRHDQELWAHSRTLGGLTCVVTGGGGGITSEASPFHSDTQYGFFDLAISKSEIKVQLINWEGKYLNHATVQPKS